MIELLLLAVGEEEGETSQNTKAAAHGVPTFCYQLAVARQSPTQWPKNIGCSSSRGRRNILWFGRTRPATGIGIDLANKSCFLHRQLRVFVERKVVWARYWFHWDDKPTAAAADPSLCVAGVLCAKTFQSCRLIYGCVSDSAKALYGGGGSGNEKTGSFASSSPRCSVKARGGEGAAASSNKGLQQSYGLTLAASRQPPKYSRCVYNSWKSAAVHENSLCVYIGPQVAMAHEHTHTAFAQPLALLPHRVPRRGGGKLLQFAAPRRFKTWSSFSSSFSSEDSLNSSGSDKSLPSARPMNYGVQEVITKFLLLSGLVTLPISVFVGARRKTAATFLSPPPPPRPSYQETAAAPRRANSKRQCDSAYCSNERAGDRFAEFALPLCPFAVLVLHTAVTMLG